MTWTTIPNTDVDPDSPITTALMIALRDNPAAIANGDAGAPQIQNAAIATDAVRAAQIQANAVGSSEIAADAVGASEIAANAVGSSEIAVNAVRTSEIYTTLGSSATIVLNGGVAWNPTEDGFYYALVTLSSADVDYQILWNGTWISVHALNLTGLAGSTGIWLIAGSTRLKNVGGIARTVRYQRYLG